MKDASVTDLVTVIGTSMSKPHTSELNCDFSGVVGGVVSH